jgi:hypothetical protein
MSHDLGFGPPYSQARERAAKGAVNDATADRAPSCKSLPLRRSCYVFGIWPGKSRSETIAPRQPRVEREATCHCSQRPRRAERRTYSAQDAPGGTLSRLSARAEGESPSSCHGSRDVPTAMSAGQSFL